MCTYRGISLYLKIGKCLIIVFDCGRSGGGHAFDRARSRSVDTERARASVAHRAPRTELRRARVDSWTRNKWDDSVPSRAAPRSSTLVASGRVQRMNSRRILVHPVSPPRSSGPLSTNCRTGPICLRLIGPNSSVNAFCAPHQLTGNNFVLPHWSILVCEVP